MPRSLLENQKFVLRFVKYFLATCILFFTPISVFAQSAKTSDSSASDTAVVQTEIGLDQIVVQKSPSGKTADRAMKGSSTPSNAANVAASIPDDQKAAMINESLKNSIEENKKLAQENMAMENELKELRGNSEVNKNRLNFLSTQRENLQARIDEIEKQNKEYAEQMERLKTTMTQKDKEFSDRLTEIQHQEEMKKEEEAKAIAMVMPHLKDNKDVIQNQKEIQELKKQAQQDLENLEGRAQKIAAQMDKVSSENKRLKLDSAKLHYNLANTFFEQGKYERAAAEYKKVVERMPNDPEAHYNLAFVCGEFLDDYKTALTHYEQYLYLNPKADDKPLVQEKILEAKLNLKSTVDSPLDKGPKSGDLFEKPVKESKSDITF